MQFILVCIYLTYRGVFDKYVYIIIYLKSYVFKNKIYTSQGYFIPVATFIRVSGVKFGPV